MAEDKKETVKTSTGKTAEKINLRDRVEVELIADMPSMRKRKGDIVNVHPKNVADLVKKKLVKKV